MTQQVISQRSAFITGDKYQVTWWVNDIQYVEYHPNLIIAEARVYGLRMASDKLERTSYIPIIIKEVK